MTNYRQIADQMKIHRNTVGNWRRTNPVFAQALVHAQYERVLFWRDAAEEYTPVAIHTIGEILLNGDAPASVRLRAALAMLQHATTLPPAPPVPKIAVMSEEAAPENAPKTDSVTQATTAEAKADSAKAETTVPIDRNAPKMHNLAQSGPGAPQTPNTTMHSRAAAPPASAPKRASAPKSGPMDGAS